VSEANLVQGRWIGPVELAYIRQMLVDHPQWSRWQLSRQLARDWEWRSGSGVLKDMAARTLLLKLEQRGWVVLPPRRNAPPGRRRLKPRATGARVAARVIIQEPLAQLLPLHYREVSRGAEPSQRARFTALLQEHHYLSYDRSVGENLQYLVEDARGRPLACVLFGAAAWQCADRDRWIGWDAATRVQQLHLVANNTRFLILPWARVPQLASHILSRIGRQLTRDWPAKYGHPIHLLETFVERDRFAGACYRAANWIRVGQTKGRTRQDRADGQQHRVAIKDIYLYALNPRFRDRLQGRPDLAPPSNQNP
jgi:hypothetical protein